MIRWALDWWRAWQRRIDLVILWPSCQRMAMEYHPSDYVEYAKAAFAVHAFRDPAWLTLGEEEIKRRIDKL